MNHTTESHQQLPKDTILRRVFEVLNEKFALPHHTNIEQLSSRSRTTASESSEPETSVYFSSSYWETQETIVVGMLVAMADAAGWDLYHRDDDGSPLHGSAQCVAIGLEYDISFGWSLQPGSRWAHVKFVELRDSGILQPKTVSFTRKKDRPTITLRCPQCKLPCAIPADIIALVEVNLTCKACGKKFLPSNRPRQTLAGEPGFSITTRRRKTTDEVQLLKDLVAMCKRDVEIVASAEEIAKMLTKTYTAAAIGRVLRRKIHPKQVDRHGNRRLRYHLTVKILLDKFAGLLGPPEL